MTTRPQALKMTFRLSVWLSCSYVGVVWDPLHMRIQQPVVSLLQIVAICYYIILEYLTE